MNNNNSNPIYKDEQLEINDYGEAVELIDKRTGDSVIVRTQEQYLALSNVFAHKVNGGSIG